MQKHHFIGLAILLDDHLFNVTRRIELDLLKKFAVKKGTSQSPHITVKQPFDADDLLLEEMYAYIDEIAKSTKQFEISVDGFGYFEPKVAYLNIEKSDTLHALHNKLNQDLMEKYNIPIKPLEGDSVVFHSTVALQDFPEDTFKEIKQYLSTLEVQHTFTASKLALFYKVDNYWIVAKAVPLSF